MNEEHHTSPSQQSQGTPARYFRKNTGNTSEKKARVSTILTAVVIIALIILFGAMGGVICLGGYWAVRAIINSRMPVAAKIIVSIIVILLFLALMAGYLYLSVIFQMQMES